MKIFRLTWRFISSKSASKIIYNEGVIYWPVAWNVQCRLLSVTRHNYGSFLLSCYKSWVMKMVKKFSKSVGSSGSLFSNAAGGSITGQGGIKGVHLLICWEMRGSLNVTSKVKNQQMGGHFYIDVNSWDHKGSKEWIKSFCPVRWVACTTALYHWQTYAPLFGAPNFKEQRKLLNHLLMVNHLSLLFPEHCLLLFNCPR